ncbi:MAG: GNAT family N-acetyltransferase [Candidatus Daviesbacteria bacterium]|nr:GNAT family N-acetyltransferase [Candidatus Daviesbacteria bacterium]
MDIQIVDQTANDVLEVSRLLRDTWLDTYPNSEHKITREEILQRYDEASPDFQERIEKRKTNVNKDPNVHSWVAKEGEKIVGFCTATKGKENRINAIYVFPEQQGRGIGWKLMKNALDWIGEADEICVNVASYNQKSIEFYEKVGFRKTSKEIVGDAGRFPSGAVIPEIEMVKTNG